MDSISINPCNRKFGKVEFFSICIQVDVFLQLIDEGCILTKSFLYRVL